VYVHRTKLLPDGGTDLDFTPEVERLQIAIQFAKSQKRVFMDRNAREMWARAYERLAVDNGGLFGAVTSRGEAQVIRLALLYAMMDCSTHIRSVHLQAALAFWQYCEDSARYIFDTLTADQELMLEFLNDGPKTRTEFLKGLFGRNRKADAINADLAVLMKRGVIGKSVNKRGTEKYHTWGRK
jgi:DNA replicative helicase MCM subunit Mcm2 (Cdc46/Mcm family)